MNVYYIGGSPCSGKSTIAGLLSEKYGLAYFKVDDHLEQYMALGAADGKPCCKAAQKMTADEIWMRPPALQCREELEIYQEIFPYIQADLNALDAPAGIITEGAAYLPLLMQKSLVPHNRYLSITPTKAFQVFHYRQREWVPYVLAECRDKEKAFENWMERDALFARAVEHACREAGYRSLINDGQMPIDAMAQQAAAHFALI